MEKMMMVSMDEYNKMKKWPDPESASVSTPTSSLTKDPPDIAAKKLYDEKLRGDAIEKNRQERENQDFQKKLKPLLAIHNEHLLDVIKRLEPSKRVQAHYVLQVLSRLPKVSIMQDRILIDGEALAEKCHNIVSEIITNGVTGRKALIDALRAGKRYSPMLPSSGKKAVRIDNKTQVRSFDKDTFHSLPGDTTEFQSLDPYDSFEDEMSSFLRKQPIKTSTPSKERNKSPSLADERAPEEKATSEKKEEEEMEEEEMAKLGAVGGKSINESQRQSRGPTKGARGKRKNSKSPKSPKKFSPWVTRSKSKAAATVSPFSPRKTLKKLQEQQQQNQHGKGIQWLTY